MIEPTNISNPFPASDPRADIWEMCARRDILSFLKADWSLCEGDFHEPGFTGWHAHGSPDPARWTLSFPTLRAYRDAWVADSRAFALRKWRDNPADSLFKALVLHRIEIQGDSALVHKRFDGMIRAQEGPDQPLRWQSLFSLRFMDGRWKQSGFVGYLPLE